MTKKGAVAKIAILKSLLFFVKSLRKPRGRGTIEDGGGILIESFLFFVRSLSCVRKGGTCSVTEVLAIP
jgi:hypothetical protein